MTDNERLAYTDPDIRDSARRISRQEPYGASRAEVLAREFECAPGCVGCREVAGLILEETTP